MKAVRSGAVYIFQPSQQGSIEDFLDRLGLSLLTILGVLSVGGIILANLGLFRSWTLMALVAASVGFLWLLLKDAPRPTKVSRLEAMPVLILVAVCALLFFPPAEFVLGGWDAGVYYNTGIALAQGGGLAWDDPFISRASPGMWGPFIDYIPGRHSYLLPGFYVSDSDSLLYSNFPMLLSLWVGAFNLVGGLRGGLYAAPIIGVMSVLFFYLFARRISGALVATVAATLLATNGVQVWHAKQSLSEELLQMMLFGGLFAGLVYIRGGRREWAIATGLALGCLPLIKTEAVFISLLAFMPLMLMAHLQQLPGRQWLATSYAVGALTTLYHYSASARFYVADQAGASLPHIALGVALLIPAAVFGIVGLRRGKLILSTFLPSTRVPPELLYLLPLGVLGFVGLAMTQGDPLYPLGAAASLWQASYMSSLEGVVLALAAVSTLLRKYGLGGLDQAILWVATVLILSSLLYLGIYSTYYRAQDEIPLYFWATRRLVPVVIPLLSLAVAVFLPRVLWWLSPPLRAVSIFVAVIAIVVFRAPDTLPVAGHREYQGALEQTRVLSEAVGPGGVVLFDKDDTGLRLSAPLRFLYDHATYVLWRPNDAPGGLEELIARAQDEGRSVYYATSTLGLSPFSLLDYNGKNVGSYSFILPEWIRTSEGRPRGSSLFTASITLFKVGPRQPADEGALANQVAVNVGEEDLLGYSIIRGGLYEPEKTPDGASFRWASEESSFAIPGWMKGPLQMKIRAASARPRELDQGELAIYCADRHVASSGLKEGFDEYLFSLPDYCLSPGGSVVTFRVDGWIPDDQGSSDDSRILGFMLERLEYISDAQG